LGLLAVVHFPPQLVLKLILKLVLKMALMVIYLLQFQ
jgi:hypothetical protein